MLSTDDQNLVDRDYALPGLALVLDPCAATSALRAALRHVKLSDVSISYVKYKPANNCLVAYRGRVNGVDIDLHIKTVRDANSPKLDKARRGGESHAGASSVALDEHTQAYFFPADARLRSLRRLVNPELRDRLLGGLFRNGPDHRQMALTTIRYKPERRYVALASIDDEPKAVIKFHTARDFDLANRAAKSVRSCGSLRIPRRVGKSRRHGVVAIEWLSGRALASSIDELALDELDLGRVGSALAELHRQSVPDVGRCSRASDNQSLADSATFASILCPEQRSRIDRLCTLFDDWRLAPPGEVCLTHGDFDPSQVVLHEDYIAFVDFDHCHYGDPAADLGGFLARCELLVLQGRLAHGQFAKMREPFLQGYLGSVPTIDLDRVRSQTAIKLLSLAPVPFRERDPQWARTIGLIVDRVETLAARRAPSLATRRACAKLNGRWDVEVNDPTGAADDHGIAYARSALDPKRVDEEFRDTWREYERKLGRVVGMTVLRHKPGRRCLIEYEVEHQSADGAISSSKVLGKVRAKGCDEATFRLARALARSGFAADCADGVSVPETISMVPRLGMWLQHKAPGRAASELLERENSGRLLSRIVEAIDKLHRSKLRVPRRHGLADELRILEIRLRGSSELAAWESRIEALLAGCRRLADRIVEPSPRLIHRDFYPDQVLVNDERLHLIDLDTCCLGDPALDIGNFAGHLVIESLRRYGRPDGYFGQEESLISSFGTLAGRLAVARARAYASLTLVRHLHISTLFEERRRWIEPLLEHCERRVAFDTH